MPVAFVESSLFMNDITWPNNKEDMKESVSW